MGCPAGVEGHCSSSSYPEVPGFKLALVEDFDQPLDLDKDSVWTWGDGALDEGQVRMTKAGISFGDGKMRLTVKRETIPGGRSEAENKNVASQMLSSGELRTKYNNYRYGRYEVRFKPPTSDGNFISTMFTFRTPKNINWREVDIELTADVKGGAGSNIVNADGRPGYPEDRAEYINVPVAGLDNQADFHTYAFEWLPNRITWFVDGKKIREYTGRTENGRMIPIPEKSAKIMMNLWIFGARYAFGGQNGARNMYPMVAEYDWFRFYRANDGEPTYPCSPTPACLPAEDKVKGAQNNPGDAIP